MTIRRRLPTLDLAASTINNPSSSSTTIIPHDDLPATASPHRPRPTTFVHRPTPSSIAHYRRRPPIRTSAYANDDANVATPRHHSTIACRRDHDTPPPSYHRPRTKTTAHIRREPPTYEDSHPRPKTTRPRTKRQARVRNDTPRTKRHAAYENGRPRTETTRPRTTTNTRIRRRPPTYENNRTTNGIRRSSLI
ncbi:hypothetical protein K443DRAFT_14677 [Laccaria amethystina LaAM-08-1]|uniref:Uncharacterized protein n=1 Tax=Laccaria amethystina LaAM-08-1 TaxID=1095629 RepID=A0A0C9WHF5_9AGAR|nr:hypothetical protein K443DRAFT_14677 [Laccaria amethystina LaAM-08-1]